LVEFAPFNLNSLYLLQIRRVDGGEFPGLEPACKFTQLSVCM